MTDLMLYEFGFLYLSFVYLYRFLTFNGELRVLSEGSGGTFP